jgi:hypothetical protein
MIGELAFAALVWGSVALVLATFGYVLRTVWREVA